VARKVPLEKTLVVDVGGNNVKFRLMPDSDERRKIPTGQDVTPATMVSGVQEAVADWSFDRVTIGCPGPVKDDTLVLEPYNLGQGWTGFDFTAAFGKPTKVVNDAAMQAIGSYEGGKMLFLGLGTGLGAALVVDTLCIALELAHMPYKKGKTFEDYVGRRGLDGRGRAKWRETTLEVIEILKAGVVADHVVLGGGNARLLRPLPDWAKLGHNENAFLGGLRLWTEGFRIV
jgi:polyphosphate glucokinase